MPENRRTSVKGPMERAPLPSLSERMWERTRAAPGSNAVMASRKAFVDPKIRRTLMLVGGLLLLVLLAAVWSYIGRVSEQNLVASPVSTDDRLVVIDGSTMIVGSEALEREMTAWLKSRKAKTLSFELSDRSFEANSAEPSAITKTRIGQVAGLARASPTVTVHILQPVQFEASAIKQLDEQRAIRLRDALVASGVSESQVIVEHEPEGLPTANSPHLAVLLTKAGMG